MIGSCHCNRSALRKYDVHDDERRSINQLIDSLKYDNFVWGFLLWLLLQPPDSLENLKMVLNVVAEVLSSGMVVELE